MLTVGVDFHGVICDRPPGYKGFTQPEWPAIPGAIDWLLALVEAYDGDLVSARFDWAWPAGAAAMRAAARWLVDRGLPQKLLVMRRGDRPPIKLTPCKPVCILYIDDRAYCFRGKFPTVQEIGDFKIWNRS